MDKLLQSAKIVICMGSGGVGKTTIAATLAFLAARNGKRVLVLTIDPSQRLRTTLGIEGGSNFTKIEHQEIKGEMFAGVVDAKKTFDDFVRRAAKGNADKILNNKLYIQLSTTLNGSQEFTAMEKLYEAYDSGKFDLIVLDTPPSQHAIDFLMAPEKLAGLFSEKITRWFRDSKGSFLSGFLQTGTKRVLKVMELLTGSEFMQELVDFFVNIEGWQNNLESRIHAVHRLLTEEITQFVLVTGFDQAKLKEAHKLSQDIVRGGYHLSSLIINRSHPSWLHLGEKDMSEGQSLLAQRYLEMKKYYQERELMYQGFAVNMKKQCQVIRLPEFDHDISDLSGIVQLSQLLTEESKA
jgi:anion-transporting  ArsA/GET3 family ATPase